MLFKSKDTKYPLPVAAVMNMEDKIGNLEVDKEFDALLIDVKVPGSPIDIFSQVRRFASGGRCAGGGGC